MKLQILIISLLHVISINHSLCQTRTNKKIEKIKTEAITIVESNYKNTQIMVDKVFSFAELGFQEVETSKYLTDILSKNNFQDSNRSLGRFLLAFLFTQIPTK